MTTTKRGQDLLYTLNLIADPRITDPRAGAEPGYTGSECPASGSVIAAVKLNTVRDYHDAVERAVRVQREWRMLPAPKRGEIVRLIGHAFRKKCEPLGELVTLEMGKIRAEGIGEIQECIDIADFCVGLSRQLYGLSMHSERPKHRMYEQWHPLGTIGIITAFNFPAAVWAWNAMVAAVCGNAMIWKPSLLTPLTAIAMTNVVHEVMRQQTVFAPKEGDATDIFPLIIGTDDEVGEVMIADRRLPLISATGSCRMGRHVGQVVARRLGRTLLELGGNNAIIVMPDADLDLTVRGVLFGAVGTAGQRCTTTRRLICHSTIVDEVASRLVKAYSQVNIGDPLKADTLMGPLISRQAVEQMRSALKAAVQQGGQILCGGEPGLARFAETSGYYVEPTIVRIPRGIDLPIAREETFAPILYIYEFDELDDAIAIQNGVDQGLSSAIFTDSVRAAERFLSHAGSDCGIANVNIGTSGAEIGGAFGGEKDTGGGRESGSDSWKHYMRRQTCTINWSTDLPLAQGIRFGE
ncbi:MAG TPA: aldehyde dehydrogenase family protein [Phycisphaerales bacterium]|nr:aldehyde dehydrogenase family protein [Phycisphaerales bacterium]HRQ75139.1 aldehyde dehydrogenase family protein [Phycisphaerales bacterium]